MSEPRPKAWRRAALVALVIALFAGIAVVGIVVGKRRPATTANAKPSSSAALRSDYNGLQPVFDDFNRPDSSASLGSTPTGTQWHAVKGTWGIKGGSAYIAKAADHGRSMAVLPGRTGDGVLTLTFPAVAADAGLLFRYANPFNYWAVVAVPKYGTFNVLKVVNGKLHKLGGLEQSGARNGTSVSVHMSGSVLDFYVDGVLRRTVHDDDLETASSCGFAAGGKQARTVRWDNFDFVPERKPATSTTAPATTAPATAPATNIPVARP
jgi:hypothetical protein